MATKYYRVLKETFMWTEGAILHDDISVEGYTAIDDVFHRVELGKEYISRHIVEDEGNKDFFERVYKSPVGTAVYLTKQEARKAYDKMYKS